VLHGQAPSAFSFQGGAFGRRAVPLAEGIGAKIIEEADVEDLKSVEHIFDVIRKQWGSLDFVVHALAFSDRNELRGRYADTTRKNFEHTMVISCFSFTEICKLAADLMPSGGSLLTLTYGGATRVVPCYNVMGVAKAALETSVRYCSGFGRKGSGECAVGGADAHAGRRHSDARTLLHYQQRHAPIMFADVDGRRRRLYLLSDCRRRHRQVHCRLRLLDHRHAEPAGAKT
jgi:enoyl-[acyl-carrier protein] reductase I